MYVVHYILYQLFNFTENIPNNKFIIQDAEKIHFCVKDTNLEKLLPFLHKEDVNKLLENGTERGGGNLVKIRYFC